MSPRTGQLILGALLTAGLTGCDPGKSEPADDAPAAERILTQERGPVSVQVHLGKERVTLGDTLTLTLEVSAEDGVDVILPQLGEQLGAFDVSAVERGPAPPPGPRRQWRVAYTLIAYSAGEHEVPGFTVQFIDRRQPDAHQDTPLQELTTAPLTVTVASVLAGEFDPAEFKDIKDPVSVPAPGRTWWLAALAAAAVLAVAALWRLRRRPAPLAPPIPPYQWALEQLRRLEAATLTDAEQIHAWYFEFSDVIRQYVERQFGLHAPERTTQEFLAELRTHSALNPRQKEVLGGCLEACDMVKFARHAPGPTEIQHALRAARRFVEETGLGLNAPETPPATVPVYAGQEVGT